MLQHYEGPALQQWICVHYHCYGRVPTQKQIEQRRAEILGRDMRPDQPVVTRGAAAVPLIIKFRALQRMMPLRQQLHAAAVAIMHLGTSDVELYPISRYVSDGDLVPICMSQAQVASCCSGVLHVESEAAL